MLLRRLEAYGFKSFADKTEIEFGKGITVVVGPNGSGKSNISDAIRWVLGEQSIRTLRGSKLEDIIFAGSSGRKPLGIAEVSLTFDNSDGTLPIDFNEVIITRRVFRSGDSEYYINKSLCRLKDIYELLADTGLGRDAMTVIGQNKVDEVLNNKPEERRLLFEESAGISKYKQRKKEAMRKLDDTAQNLIRISDITSELESQLTPMAESARRTAAYNELHSELTAYQVSLLLSSLERSEKMVESAAQQAEHLTVEDAKASAALSIRETQRLQLSDRLSETDEQLSAYTAAINQAATDLEKLNGRTAVLAERLNHNQQNQQRIRQQQQLLAEQQTLLTEKLADSQTSLAARHSSTQELSALLLAQHEAYQAVLHEIEHTRQRVEDKQGKTLDYMQAMVEKRNEIANIERDCIKLSQDQDTLAADSQSLSTQLSAAKTEQTAIAAEQNSIAGNLHNSRNQQHELQSLKEEQQRALEKIFAAKQQINNHLHELNSRSKILTNMQTEYEGFARGIKSVLKSDAPWHQGICGAVAQVLTVPDKYVTAVEIALGGALQHIITENADTAKAAMAFLKQQNLGRATFLPLDTVKAMRPRDNELAAVKSPGSLGFAAALVSCEPRYRTIIDSLLGRTVIAENIDVALTIAKQQHFSVKIVTLDGEVLNPGGSMTGGSVGKRDSSFLSRSNAIAAIQVTIEEEKTALSAIQQKLQAAQQQLSTTEQQLSALLADQQKIQVRQAQVEVHADKILQEIERLAAAQTAADTMLKASSEKQNQLQENLGRCRQEIAELEAQDAEHQQKLSVWQQKASALQEKRDAIQHQITELKIQCSAVQQEINSITLSQQQDEHTRRQLMADLDRLQQELNGLQQEEQSSTQEMTDAKAEQETLQQLRDEAENEQRSCTKIKLDILSEVQQADKELKELRRKQTDLQNRLHEAAMLSAKYTYELEHAEEKLREQFVLSREEAAALRRLESLDSMTKKAQALEQEIAALGPVNHGAISEYQQLQGRYEFLQSQSQDLISAKEYLASIIADIDKTMSVKFLAAFKEINEHFSDIFVRLFGGGSAELRLTDPDNMLGTGIDIAVQAPGKKMQNLALLSGGERTLTVIALLFAFLAYRPAPLIVVDEIDASLDEANVNRLSEFLQDYARNTQFIVVTHRKGTMEVADIIYGVTMEQSGVSRLVSVKLMEKTG